MSTEHERDAGVAITEVGVDLDGIDPEVYAKRWKTLAVLCASLIIVIVGNTVLNVALPTLQRPTDLGGLGASNTAVQWVVDAYGLIFAGLLFTAAALGDRFGRKGALQAGLLIFAAGSVLGSMADSSGVLIAARAIMGIGAAFVMPSTLSILTNVFPARERAKAIAIWAGISGSGAAVGPIASGLLLEHYWWGSVFLVNLPIIAVAMIAGQRLVPKSKDATESPLDPIGALLSIVGLSALVYAIIEGPHHGWISAASVLWFGLAAVVLVAFGVWEWRTRHPMLDLRLFRNRRFAVSSGGITLVFFAMFGTFFMLSQYLQGVLEYSPLGASVRMLPFSVVMMAVAPQTPKLVARLGADRIGAAGLLLVTAGLIGTAMFRPDTAYLQLAVTMGVLAGGMALTMTPMTTQLMASVPRDRAGMGSATNDTTRELGGALGVAVLGSLLTSQYTSGVSSTVAGLPGDVREIAEGSIGGVRGLIEQGVLTGDQAGRILTSAKDAFVDGLSIAAIVAATVTFVAAIVVKRSLPSDRTSPEVTGEPARAEVPVAGS
ncbi:MAG: DHA2 family efflux MFS transporter permease subunit [Acidimicrobiia bacterium]|nr:DHA2 family efflux MFS transporter permease subunit [Acidimicrobiia bacterium]